MQSRGTPPPPASPESGFPFHKPDQPAFANRPKRKPIWSAAARRRFYGHSPTTHPTRTHPTRQHHQNLGSHSTNPDQPAFANRPKRKPIWSAAPPRRFYGCNRPPKSPARSTHRSAHYPLFARASPQPVHQAIYQPPKTRQVNFAFITPIVAFTSLFTNAFDNAPSAGNPTTAFVVKNPASSFL
jgi:hypothetical protein